MDQNVALVKLIICKSNPIEKGVELMDQSWYKGWQRDVDVLVLHDLQDLQALGSLTSATSFPATPPFRPLFGVAIAHVYHHNDAISRMHDLRLCI